MRYLSLLFLWSAINAYALPRREIPIVENFFWSGSGYKAGVQKTQPLVGERVCHGYGACDGFGTASGLGFDYGYEDKLGYNPNFIYGTEGYWDVRPNGVPISTEDSYRTYNPKLDWLYNPAWMNRYYIYRSGATGQ